MPKAKALPKRKPLPPKKAARKTARQSAPSRHRPIPKKPPQKVRPAMPEVKTPEETKTGYNASSTAERRGAGSGEHANATRGRTHGGDAQYPQGDIEKGRIDPEELTQGQTATLIAARDRRAYLIDQGQKNEAANDELNAIQTEQNKKVQLAQNIIQDPDHMRDESMETAVNALKMHDPDTAKKNAEAVQKRNQKRAADNKAKDK
jgi:hypothetical protein